MLQSQLAAQLTPDVTGTLAQRPLARLLLYVVERGMTGCFELVAPTGERVLISLEGGMVTRAWTSEPVCFLGQVLQEMGALDASALGDSLAEAAGTRRLHGEVLLRDRIVSPLELSTALRRQRARKLAYAFGLPPETTFAFWVGKDFVGKRADDAPPMDPIPAIWQGLLAHPPWAHVQSTLATIGEAPLRWVGTVARLGLGWNELRAVERLRERSASVPEWSAASELEPCTALLLAYLLVITKSVEVGRAADGAPPSCPPAREDARPSFRSGEYQRAPSGAVDAPATERDPPRQPEPVADAPATQPSTYPPPPSSRPMPTTRRGPVMHSSMRPPPLTTAALTTPPPATAPTTAAPPTPPPTTAPAPDTQRCWGTPRSAGPCTPTPVRLCDRRRRA